MAIYRGVGGSGDSATGEDVFGDNSSITSLNGLSGAIQTPTYIKFSATANHTANQGELTWNATEGTLDLGLNHGGVVLQIGQETHYRVTNQSGVTIPNGELVCYAGTTGNSGKLLVELWDGSQGSETILGLATEQITNGSNGYVTCFGKVRGIQTNGGNYSETWADGDELYPGTSGGLTNVLPTAPNPKQVVAYVVNSHGSNGELFVRVEGHTSLKDDELVQLTSLTNGDILQYNSVNGRFENVPFTAGTVTNVSVVTANGLAGSVANSTTTPAITLSTTVTGVLKGNGTAISAALAGTDYLAPSAIGVTVQGYDADTAKLDVAQSWTAQQTFKELKDTVHTITDGAAFEIDPANGSIQIVTLGANRTPAATNFEAGQIVLLGINDGTAFTITWTTVAVTWVKAGGTASAPTLATTGFTWVLLWKVGSTIYGLEVGKP